MVQAAQLIFGRNKIKTRLDYVSMSREGISMEAFFKVQEYTALSNDEIATILPISERQLTRYKKDHLLKKNIGSHLIQLIELFEKGYDLFGIEKFQKWIRTSIIALGNNRPIDLMDTSIGMEIVEDTIGRIEHGVYS